MIMNKFLSLLLLFLAIVGCNINDPADPEDAIKNPVPHLPQISYDAWGSLILSWECDNSTESVTISELPQSSSPRVFKLSAGERQLTVPGLTIGAAYNWQVEVRVSADSTLKGPTWSFVYQPGGQNKEGYIFRELSVKNVLPHIIDAHFQITDLYNKGVTALSVNDFILFEDGEPVSVSESQSTLVNKPVDKYESKIIILLDVSTSIQNAEIDEIKKAAVDFVNGISGDISAGHKKIAIYKFSTALELVLDYSTSQTDIVAAINSISSQWSTTNLYGAVADAADLMDDKIGIDEVIKHLLIVFTDGTDTQGSRQFSEALTAVSGKMVFTVGLGNEIDEGVLSAIGISGFYRIDDSADQLMAGIQNVQTELEKFVNSFYRLKYRTPKRGVVNHELTINLNVNPFSGLNSNLVVNYNSAEFFDVAAGIYIDSDQTDPDGIDSLFLVPNQEKIIIASAYLLDNDPDFDWSASVAHSGKAFITADPEDNTKAFVRAGPVPWITRFNLTDTNNSGYLKTLYIVVR